MRPTKPIFAKTGSMEGAGCTLAMTACRVSDAPAFHACDADLEAAELRIVTLERRTSHGRAVPVPEDLVGFAPLSSCTTSGAQPADGREHETESWRWFGPSAVASTRPEWPGFGRCRSAPGYGMI